MDLYQAVMLALIQGLTEFLPVSSSAHLILPSQVLGWPDQGAAFDVAVHLGTLTAVVAYFFADLRRILTGFTSGVQQRHMNADVQLGLNIVIATIPAVIVGGLFHEFIETHLRSGFVIAFTTIIFGLLLWASEKAGSLDKQENQMTWVMALIIGMTQAVALVPGTSRSGITLTAALFLGFSRTVSARFSMLLSIPIILAAGALEIFKLIQATTTVDWWLMGVGMVVSATSAFLCIHLFMSWLERIGVLPFVVYRVLMGIGLFALALS